MQKVDTNNPDTRARVAARRESRKARNDQASGAKSARRNRQSAGQEASRTSNKSDRLFSRRQAAQPTSKKTQETEASRVGVGKARWGSKTSATGSTSSTGAVQQVRAEARSRKRGANASSQVRPGTRQALYHWLGTGRLFSFVVFLASIGVLVYLFTSPRFTVQQVEVAGNSILKDAFVSELSGLAQMPIWFIDDDTAINRLLQNAYVEEAHINVALPNQAMIQISERRPEVRWTVNGVQYLIDGSGRVLDVAQEPADPDTLVIVGSANQQLQPMDHVDTDAMELARALALRLPNELQFTPAVIGWDLGLGVYVKSSSDQLIIFGRTDNLDRKLAFLKLLLEDGTAFTYLDLRPSNPFYKSSP